MREGGEAPRKSEGGKRGGPSGMLTSRRTLRGSSPPGGCSHDRVAHLPRASLEQPRQRAAIECSIWARDLRASRVALANEALVQDGIRP